MEEQTEFDINWYDYGARNYDAQIGRFFSVDALSEVRYYMTPYHYVQNNPMIRIDPDGNNDISILASGIISIAETDDDSDTFSYIDSDGNSTSIGTFDKNENGLIQLGDFDFDNGTISFGFSVKDGNEDESYLSGEGLGALLGALIDSGVDDLVVTRASNSDGSSPGDSRSHVGGRNFDTRFLRNDGSSAGLDLRDSFNLVDQGRTSSFNTALNKFGYKNLRASETTEVVNAGIAEFETYKTNRVPGTINLSNHYDHQHNQGFSPSIRRSPKKITRSSINNIQTFPGN